jgi:hypothetical protein
MTASSTVPSLTRRSAIATLGAAGASLAVHRLVRASAQAGGDLTGHPLTGMWLALANPPMPDHPQFTAPSFFGADGTVVGGPPVSPLGPDGVQFNSDLVGVWEPHDEWTGHFTAVQILSDAEGMLLGTVTVDGYPRVNEDGQTFIDDGSLVTVTIRDVAGSVMAIQPPGSSVRPVTAIRMTSGRPGIPESSRAF